MCGRRIDAAGVNVLGNIWEIFNFITFRSDNIFAVDARCSVVGNIISNGGRSPLRACGHRNLTLNHLHGHFTVSYDS